MEEYEQEKQLIDYLNVIWKRKWFIAIPTFFLCVAVGIYSFLMPDVWEVDTIIQPSKFFVQTETGEFQEVVVVDPNQISGQINQNSYNYLIAAELNMDVRKFPGLEAEQLKDTNLIRVSLKTGDIDQAKSILSSLFIHLKRELDKKIDVEINTIETQKEAKQTSIKQNEFEIKDKENLIALIKLQIKDRENEIRTKNNEIQKKNNTIQLKDLVIKSKEIEKDGVLEEIESYENKLIISKDRVKNIMEEMKAVKERIDDLEEQQKKALEQVKEGIEAISLLLYSNEVQQNLRYYNTLDEKLVNERITQENLNLAIREKREELKQIDNQISQSEPQKNTIKVEIDDIKVEIDDIKTKIAKIENEIETVKNEISKINNTISSIRSEITLLEEKKGRIDYAQMIKAPTSSLGPVAPKKKQNVMLAGIIGLMIFGFLAFFLEYIEEQKKA